MPAIVTSVIIHRSAFSCSSSALLFRVNTTAPSSSPPSARSSSYRSIASSLTPTATLVNSSPAPRTMTASTGPGNFVTTPISESPNTRPSTNFNKPRHTTLAPLLAPNLHCAASPPAPWHTGIAPNQHPTRFIAATLSPNAVTPTGNSGIRSPANADTATTLFSVVSGICPSAMPSTLMALYVLPPPNQAGTPTLGTHGIQPGLSSLTVWPMAHATPATNNTSANGTVLLLVLPLAVIPATKTPTNPTPSAANT
ncbi:hypothetical protein NKR19_g405, partial [Coniochaeta hoffmannii]